MMDGAGQKLFLKMIPAPSSRLNRIESAVESAVESTVESTGADGQIRTGVAYFSESGTRSILPCDVDPKVNLNSEVFKESLVESRLGRNKLSLESLPSDQQRAVEFPRTCNKLPTARRNAGHDHLPSSCHEVSRFDEPALRERGDRIGTGSLREQGWAISKGNTFLEPMENTSGGAFQSKVVEVQKGYSRSVSSRPDRNKPSVSQKKEQESEFKAASCYTSGYKVLSDQRDDFFSPTDLPLEELMLRLKEARSDSTVAKLSRILAGNEVVPGANNDVLIVKRMIDKLKNFEYALQIINELKDASDTSNPDVRDVVVGVNHPIIKRFKYSIDRGELRASNVYEGILEYNYSSGELRLSLKQSIPITMQTPQPVTGNPFEKGFVKGAESKRSAVSERRGIDCGGKSDAVSSIQLVPDSFNNPRLYLALVERVTELNRKYPCKDETCGAIRILIRFRSDVPHDQRSSNMDHRLGASRKEPREFYRSETLKLPWLDTFYPKYLEIQVPVMDEIPINLRDLVDPNREPLSNLKLLGWQQGNPESINTRQNRNILRDETRPAIRNMNLADPKNNGLAGDHRGMGIGVNVNDHPKFGSLVFKSGTLSLDHIQTTVAHITSKINCTLYQGISRAAKVIGRNFDYCPSDGFPVEINSLVSKKRQYGESESDSVQDEGFCSDIQLPVNMAVNLPVNIDELKKETSDGGPKVSEFTTGNNNSEKKEIPINQKRNRYALLQTRLSEKEKLGHMITDPEVHPNVALNGLYLELMAMYLVMDINALLEIPGFKRASKFNIDGNPDNFIIRDGRFALIDQTPANSSINDSVFPGNQYLTRAWFPRRADFNHKLSTVFEFSLFFVPAMLFRLSRQVDEDYSLLMTEGVVNERLKYEIDRHNYIIDTFFGWCALDDKLMKWVVSCFTPFLIKNLTVEIFEGKGVSLFFDTALECFDDFIHGKHVTEPHTESHKIDLSSLDNPSKIKLLRLCANVVYTYLGKIKADEKMLLKKMIKSAEPCRGIGSGITNDGWYSDSEVLAFVSNVTHKNVDCFLPSSDVVENSFYRVVLQSVTCLSKKFRFSLGDNIENNNIEAFKETLTGASTLSAINKENSNFLPVVQKGLSQLLRKNIDFIVIRLFCGNEKEIRTQLYSWSQSSESSESSVALNKISVMEYRGEEKHNECIRSIQRPTIILINHRINCPDLVRDVDQFLWSALVFGKERPVNLPAYALKLPITYAPEIPASEQVLFDGFLSEFEKLYHKLARNEVSDTSSYFLKKMMNHLPANCGEWHTRGNGEGRAYISMRLSPNKISRIPLLLRVFHDVLREEQCQLPTRMYVIMKHPSRGYYVRWTFRIFGEVPCMNFRKPFKPEELAEDLGTSETAKVICLIVNGKKSLSTGGIFDIKDEAVSIKGYIGYKPGYLVKSVPDTADKAEASQLTPPLRSGYDDGDHLSSLEGLSLFAPDDDGL